MCFHIDNEEKQPCVTSIFARKIMRTRWGVRRHRLLELTLSPTKLGGKWFSPWFSRTKRCSTPVLRIWPDYSTVAYFPLDPVSAGFTTATWCVVSFSVSGNPPVLRVRMSHRGIDAPGSLVVSWTMILRFDTVVLSPLPVLVVVCR